MKNLKQILYFIFLVFCFTGCAQVLEPFKVILGTSTRKLERARLDALKKTYTCTFDECFDAILSLQRQKKSLVFSDTRTSNYKTEDLGPVKKQPGEEQPLNEKGLPQEPKGHFEVFRKDRIKGFIIVMGVKDQIDTTEVGIFLTKVADQTYTIDIASLSSRAKQTVAQVVFEKLSQQFEERQ